MRERRAETYQPRPRNFVVIVSCNFCRENVDHAQDFFIDITKIPSTSLSSLFQNFFTEIVVFSRKMIVFQIEGTTFAKRVVRNKNGFCNTYSGGNEIKGIFL